MELSVKSRKKVMDRMINSYTFLILTIGMIVTISAWAEETPFIPAMTFGNRGSGVGQFFAPGDIALDKEGNIYVLDTGNNRVQKFDPGGNFLMWFGGAGKEEGKFNNPSSIAVDDSGNIYISDTTNNRVQKFDPGGDVLLILKGGEGDKRFHFPRGVFVNKQGIYVADSGFATFTIRNRLRLFNQKGEELKEIKLKELSLDKEFDPQDLAVDDEGNIYVTDRGLSQVEIFDKDGDLLRVFGRKGRKPAEFFDPTGIYLDTEGNIYVADSGNNRIQKFDNRGNYSLQYGTIGTESGRFDYPRGIVLDSQDNIYIADKNNNRVQKITPTQVVLLDNEGWEYYHQESWDKAIEIWRNVLKLNNSIMTAHLGLAEVYAKQKRWPLSMSKFEDVLAIDPNNVTAGRGHRATYIYTYLTRIILIIGAIVLASIGIVALMRAGRRRYLPARAEGITRMNPIIGVLKLWEYIWGIVANPFRTMERINRENWIFLTAIFIFLVSIITVTADMLLSPLVSNMSILFLLPSSYGFQFVFPFILWLMASFFFTKGADIVGGAMGKFKAMLTVGGYALVPHFLLSIPLALLSRALIPAETELFEVLRYPIAVLDLFLILIAIKEVCQLSRWINTILAFIFGIMLNIVAIVAVIFIFVGVRLILF